MTWNVNGLRAVLKKSALDWALEQKPDVLCMQEIKARQEQLQPEELEKFSGYQAIWNPAQRPGYSGVLSLVRGEPDEIFLGMGIDAFDREGRLVRTRHNDLLVYNIYFPNGQRDHGRLSFKLDFYGELLTQCRELMISGEQLILCGDFNTAHQEIDLKNARQNSNTSGFLPEERSWIDRYLENGFVDAYRQLYPERVEYTWWTFIGNARARNTGWRLDYFLLSRQLLARVRDVVIHTQVPGSDHCPVSLYLD